MVRVVNALDIIIIIKDATHHKQKLLVTNHNCVRLLAFNTAARAIMVLPEKIERLVNADLNVTCLVTLTCGKTSAIVTQVKQVSQTLYIACAQCNTMTHTNYYTFITILLGKGKTQAEYCEGTGQQKPIQP